MLISVGDEMKTASDTIVTVESIQQGKYGLLVYCISENGESFHFYSPYELPPQTAERDWYNWTVRGLVTLTSGIVLGRVNLLLSDPMPRTIEEYDARWERTIELMNKEEQDNGDRLD